MKVEQYKQKNQFHIYSDITYEQENGEQVDILQSYNSVVVKILTDFNNGETTKKITLGCDWDYSTTTSKYVYMFLEEYGDVNFYGIANKRAYINKLIKDGVINYNGVLQ